MSQNNTFESIVLCLLFFIIGGAVTCHLMKNRYPAPTTITESKLDTHQVEILSQKIQSLEKTFSDRVNIDDKIKKLEAQNSEILIALSELKSLKKEVAVVPQVVVPPSQPSVHIDYSKIANMVGSQTQLQNAKISDLSQKLESLESRLKESVSNSWVNDQKLNEIKALLSQKNQQLPIPKVESSIPVQKQPEQPQIVKKYVDSVEQKPVARTLSIRADLPSDYQAPKKVYKVDELK